MYVVYSLYNILPLRNVLMTVRLPFRHSTTGDQVQSAATMMQLARPVEVRPRIDRQIMRSQLTLLVRKIRCDRQAVCRGCRKSGLSCEYPVKSLALRRNSMLNLFTKAWSHDFY